MENSCLKEIISDLDQWIMDYSGSGHIWEGLTYYDRNNYNTYDDYEMEMDKRYYMKR
jgi:hypothetical protein